MAAYTTIDDPSAYFKVQLYTGNAGTQSITFNDTDTAMQPDLNWIKCRGAAENHVVSDSVRGSSGSGGYYAMHPNNTNGDQTNTTNLYVSSLDSNGFSVGSNDQVNVAQPFVSWNWKESATSGFDIVSYTGNGSARTISHSLSAVPSMMIVKNRESTYGWQVYHHKNTSAPETEIIYLHADTATADSNVEWNDIAPTSSVFTVGTDVGVNENTKGMIAFLFAEKQGFSKISSFVGNGNADGTFVYTGFKPAFLMIKAVVQQSWDMMDNKRSPINPVALRLYADLANADNADPLIDFLSNGFKIRDSLGANNESGTSYIYMAFAEAPFVNSNGVPCNAR